MTNGLPSTWQAHSSSALNLSDSSGQCWETAPPSLPPSPHRKMEQLVSLNTLTTRAKKICVKGKHFIVVSCSSYLHFSLLLQSDVILNPSTLCIWTGEISFKPCSPLGSAALEFVPHAVALAELLTERHRHIHTLSRLPPTFEHTLG